MVTSLPIKVGCVPFITCTTVGSWMLLRVPILIRWTSPRTTAFIQTDDSAPISTSPITCALSSTYALECTLGATPLYCRSMRSVYRTRPAPGSRRVATAADARPSGRPRRDVEQEPRSPRSPQDGPAAATDHAPAAIPSTLVRPMSRRPWPEQDCG